MRYLTTSFKVKRSKVLVLKETFYVESFKPVNFEVLDSFLD